MPALKKRKKVTRMRGSHTHARGFKKKARGSGHRGGKGMAGTGKRGDQRKTYITAKYGNKYFGKSKTRRRAENIKLEVITLENINNNIESYIKKGIAKESKGSYEIDLKKYKIIGNGQIEKRVIVFAKAASAGAKEAIKKSGGEIVLEKK